MRLRLGITLTLCAALLLVARGPSSDLRASSTRVSSIGSGKWSDPNTWADRSVPSSGSLVMIERGTNVEYDKLSTQELASVEIAGVLTFSRTQSTSLDVGNIFVRDGGVLDMGTADRVIPAAVVAEIRFVVPRDAAFVGGDFAPSDVGLWVFHGGRWDVHGAPIQHTWAKLARTMKAGDTTAVVREDLRDWARGAAVIVTPTSIAPGTAEFEERTVASVRRQDDGVYGVTLATPLAHLHEGGSEFSGEVALLTRNVRIMSKYPERPKAHTMFMAGSSGQIAYAEFRDLGTLGVLGRYPIHFHFMGDSSRGMSVRGASIWRSDNHFLNVHGSNGVSVVDTVGYDAAGSGFFIEGLRANSPQAVQRQPLTKGERQEGTGPRVSPEEKQRLKRERRRAQREQQPRKGAEPSGNMEFAFIGNLAVKGIWRRGSLDEPFRVALYWISAFNGLFIGNVAVGVGSGRNSSGFHLAENGDASLTRPPLLMLRNEAHSSAGHGLFSWTNSKLPIEVIDFRAWRNGKSGAALGAYHNHLRLFRLRLNENRETNVSVWVHSAWIQDSILSGSHVGIFFNRHPVAGSPDSPGMIINSQFRDHTIADVSQDHAPCPTAGEEQFPTSRRCTPNYARFLNPQFTSRRAVDFGWHENVHSWIDAIGWRSRPAGLPEAFRLVRKDLDEGAGVNRAFDAAVRPLTGVWDSPPTVDLHVTQIVPGSIGLSVQAADDRAIAAVDLLADGEVIKQFTHLPYEIVWSAHARFGRVTYLYARAVDTAGNVAYSQVVPLVVRSP